MDGSGSTLGMIVEQFVWEPECTQKKVHFNIEYIPPSSPGAILEHSVAIRVGDKIQIQICLERYSTGGCSTDWSDVIPKALLASKYAKYVMLFDYYFFLFLSFLTLGLYGMSLFKADPKKMSKSLKWQIMMIPFNFKVFELEAVIQFSSRSIWFFS